MIWLDVDGVINPLEHVRDRFQEEFPDAVQVPCVCRDNEWPVMYSPTVVRKINEWSMVAEVRWLTTWTQSARYRLAPLLGLYDFEVCAFAKGQARCPRVHRPGDLQRALIWIDDEDLDDEVCKHIPRSFLLRPPRFLSHKDMAFVDARLAQFAAAQ
jgi:hypothetical protein